MSYTQQDIDRLLQLLKSSGFEEPFAEWLTLRVQSIGFSHEEHMRRRDTNALTSSVDYAREQVESVWHTMQLLDRWSDVLTGEKISDDPRWGDGGAWSTVEPAAISEEEFSTYILPSDFTEIEVETARRILYNLAKSATAVYKDQVARYEARPVKNERPEVTAVIGGFARIWCQAMRIPESDIAISSSAGSPAMNFIEAGAAIFLPKPPQRESIERHVIAYRNEKRAMMS